MFLPLGARVLRVSLAVESALIADADAFTVEALCVRSDFLYPTGGFDVPVFADIEVISRSVESPSAVADVQVMFCKVPVLTRGGAVDHYQIYRSHNFT